jgi:hypothetical protein
MKWTSKESETLAYQMKICASKTEAFKKAANLLNRSENAVRGYYYREMLRRTNVVHNGKKSLWMKFKEYIYTLFY